MTTEEVRLTVDHVLAADAVRVIGGFACIIMARTVIGLWRRIARWMLGAGFVFHGGYWCAWRWCKEAGLRDIAAAMIANQNVPFIATTLLGAGLVLCMVAPYIDGGRSPAIALVPLGLALGLIGALFSLTPSLYLAMF